LQSTLPNLPNLSISYLLVGGTGPTKPGDLPSYCGNTFTDSTNELRKCESAIVGYRFLTALPLLTNPQWVYNASSSRVTPIWINDDGLAVPAFIGYTTGAFVLTGSIEDFENTWSNSVEWIVGSFDFAALMLSTHWLFCRLSPLTRIELTLLAECGMRTRAKNWSGL
jgi:hypothetical protein